MKRELQKLSHMPMHDDREADKPASDSFSLIDPAVCTSME